MIRLLIVAGTLAGLFPGQADKQELRYKLAAGEKLQLDIKYGVTVKLDKVPEILQGAVGEDLLDLKFEGTLAAETGEKSAQGATPIDAKWKSMKAKGHALVEDIDFKYDAEKKAEEKPSKKDVPAESGMLNLQQRFEDLSKVPLKVTVDPLGNVKMSGGDPKQDVAQQFMALNGLMGPLPQDKVGKGDSWKGELKLEIPIGTVTIPLKIRSENKHEGEEKGLAVIQSKLRVGAAEGDGEEEIEIDPTLGLKMKLKGEGKGKTLFSAAEGRPSKSENEIQVKFSTQFPNPGGGDDIKLEGTLKIQLVLGLTR